MGGEGGETGPINFDSILHNLRTGETLPAATTNKHEVVLIRRNPSVQDPWMRKRVQPVIRRPLGTPGSGEEAGQAEIRADNCGQ